MTYKQKDLGYKRATTRAMLRIAFDNGEKWDVPLQIIADCRDDAFADEEEDTVKFVREGGLDEYEFKDWFSNNMNWSEVAEYAVKVAKSDVTYDYDSEAVNAEKSIEGKV